MASSKLKPQEEDTCHYCLYLESPPGSRHSNCGNCSLHKGWIESAGRTTCSDMSNRRLRKGIYQLFEQTRGVWLYTCAGKSASERALVLSPEEKGREL
jgi:hypothetical protein